MKSTGLESNFESNLRTSSVPLKELLKSKQDVELARIIFDIPFSPKDFIETYLDLWIHAKLPYKINKVLDEQYKDPVVGFIVRRYQVPGYYASLYKEYNKVYDIFTIKEEQIIFQYITDKDYQPISGVDQIPSILNMTFESIQCSSDLTPEQRFELQEEMWGRVNQIFKNVDGISKIFK